MEWEQAGASLLLLLSGASALGSRVAADTMLLEPGRTGVGRVMMMASRPQVVIESISTGIIPLKKDPTSGAEWSEFRFVASTRNAQLLPALGPNGTGPFLMMELWADASGAMVKLWGSCTDTGRSPDAHALHDVLVESAVPGTNVSALAYIADRCFAPGESGFHQAHARDSAVYQISRETFHVLDVPEDESAEREPLVRHFKQSLQRALRNESTLGGTALGRDVLGMAGMSGSGVRHLLNNLMGYSGGVRYLEVGLWAGSTLCSSLANNALEFAVGVDNWSQFNGPREAFMSNLQHCRGDNLVHILERDMLEAAAELRDPASPPSALHTQGANIYLFDGPHGFKDQYAAITHFFPLLSEVCLILVDDYNYPNGQAGTEAALRDLVEAGEASVLYKGGS